MKQELYKKSNNLFQSPQWLAFQKKYGRTTHDFGDFSGLVADLPLGKKFVWAQKAPEEISNFEFRISNLPKGTVFVRIEPGELFEKDITKLSLKKVTEQSLLSGQKSPKATRLLDISGTEDDILAQMKSKTRYNIRLANKKGVTVKKVDDADVLHKLLTKTAGRDKGYSPHEKAYYSELVANLGKDNLAHVFVAEHEGDFLAAILVSFYGEVATYLHGGFDDSKRNLMAPYLCQWEAIKYAKSQGCNIYDFWGVAETDDPKDPWSGISRFKEGFGGERVIFPGSYDIVVNKFWYNLLTFLARVRKVFR